MPAAAIRQLIGFVLTERVNDLPVSDRLRNSSRSRLSKEFLWSICGPLSFNNAASSELSGSCQWGHFIMAQWKIFSVTFCFISTICVRSFNQFPRNVNHWTC